MNHVILHPPVADMTAKAEAAGRFAASALNAIESLRFGRVECDAKGAIAAFVGLLNDLRVDLSTALPTRECNVCARAAVEYRIEPDQRTVCVVCAHDRLEQVRQFERDEVAPEGATRLGILKAALDAVHHRSDRHGPPSITFAQVADVWNAHLGKDFLGEKRLTAVHVALLLATFKLVRAGVNPKHVDNWVDAAGYSSCGGEVAALEEGSR